MLEQLIAEACKYGRIHLYQSDNGTFSFKIEFNTVEHVKLEAKSGFRHLTVESAVVAAIKKAIEITDSFGSNKVNTAKSKELLKCLE